MRATALILAGGRSTRMGGVPKHQLPLGDGRPILRHLLDALELADIAPVVLGDVEGKVDASFWPHEVIFLPDAEKFAGTARAVAGAAKFLNHRKTEPILICYGDTFLPGFDYASACYPGTLTIACERAEYLFDAVGNVNVDFDGARYQPDPLEAPEVWIDVGATCVRFGDLGDVGRYANLPDWLATQKFNRLCIHDGPVLTSGDPKSYEHAKEWKP